MVLAGHSTGRFYPWIIAVFFVSMSLLVLLALNGSPLSGILSGGVILGVAYRLYFNFHSPTPVGISSHSYPERIDTFVAAGELGAVGGYYGSASGAPFHRLLHGMFSIIGGVDGYYSLFLYAILIGVLYPLFVVAILKVFDIDDHRILGAAVILALVTTEGLRRAYWPRQQVLAAFFFIAAAYVLVKYVQNPNARMFFLIGAFSAAMAFSHKLPLAIFAFVLFVMLLLYLTERITWDNLAGLSPVQQVVSLFTFVFVLAWTQMIYMEGMYRTLVSRILRFTGQFGGGSVDLQSTGSGVEATAAEQALPGMIANFYQYPSGLSLFVERGHGIWILLLAGLAWAYLFFAMRERKTRGRVLSLLAPTAACAGLTVIGVISIRALNPTRTLHLAEPLLVIIVVLAVWRASLLDRAKILQIGVALVFVLFIASQVFAMAAAPDYANSPRYYADAPEATAQTTICEFASGDVYGEQELGYFNGIDHQSNCISSLGTGPDSALFNAEITPDEHSSVMMREDIDTYHGRFDRFSLTWEPMTELRTDYNVVYNNDQAMLFTSSNEGSTND